MDGRSLIWPNPFWYETGMCSESSPNHPPAPRPTASRTPSRVAGSDRRASPKGSSSPGCGDCRSPPSPASGSCFSTAPATPAGHSETEGWGNSWSGSTTLLFLLSTKVRGSCVWKWVAENVLWSVSTSNRWETCCNTRPYIFWKIWKSVCNFLFLEQNRTT